MTATLMEPARNRELAQFAVATTGLGNVEDKINKNHRKTLGLLRDIAAVKTCGVIGEIPQKGPERLHLETKEGIELPVAETTEDSLPGFEFHRHLTQ